MSTSNFHKFRCLITRNYLLRCFLHLRYTHETSTLMKRDHRISLKKSFVERWWVGMLLCMFKFKACSCWKCRKKKLFLSMRRMCVVYLLYLHFSERIRPLGRRRRDFVGKLKTFFLDPFHSKIRFRIINSPLPSLLRSLPVYTTTKPNYEHLPFWQLGGDDRWKSV